MTQANVANFLLAVAFRRGLSNPITVPISRADMADHLGMSVGALCRDILHFAEAELITIINVSQVEIIDITALEKIAYGERDRQPDRRFADLAFAPRFY